MKLKDKEAKEDDTKSAAKEEDNEMQIDYKIEKTKIRQQSRRDKLVERMRGLITESTTANQQELAIDDQVQLSNEYNDKIHIQNLSNLSSYYKEFNKVLESADVLIEVLDARDPLGTRCEEIEKAIIAAGPKKRLILLLNKVDLIPSENLRAWLKYLRNEFPTVAFKASTQKQKNRLGRINKDILNATESMLKSSKCIGANALMKLLGNYCRNQGLRTAINVGVVGYPNVGKSSVINSLIRNRSCGVGSTPGFTKTVQYIYLDSKIKLLDSPGIVFAKANSKENSEFQAANLALRNCIKIEKLNDPILPVKAILARVTKDDLLVYYGIGNFETVDQFLILLARRFGKLKKGGIVDTYAAAKQILSDWNIGKIKYYTCPPDVHDLPAYISTELVGEFSKGFDLNDEEDEINEFNSETISEMIIQEKYDDGGVKLIDDEFKEEEHAKDKFDLVLKKDTVIKFKKKKEKEKKGDEDVNLLKGMQLNKQLKLSFKKQKKKEKRIIKVSEKMSKELEESLKLF